LDFMILEVFSNLNDFMVQARWGHSCGSK